MSEHSLNVCMGVFVCVGVWVYLCQWQDAHLLSGRELVTERLLCGT